jgi:hypothetical protein
VRRVQSSIHHVNINAFACCLWRIRKVQWKRRLINTVGPPVIVRGTKDSVLWDETLRCESHANKKGYI